MIPPSLNARKEPFLKVGGISRYMEVTGRTTQRADHSLEEILGRTSQNSYYSFHGVRPDFETYIADVPSTGRTLNGDIYVQRELQRLDDMRSRVRNNALGS
ncbi:hypothetical protein L6164_030956 [Bauhinia variegata]|uniref:Uncharacterized protein n=1 Tax=Bauhinia variegata TaxID=167791 RepID=A0ACB9LE39_BAUVA|nr:hypothetical protein L6164_030956 [Bauhinia variegata]